MVYRPTARVLTVLELLQTHGRLTGAALAGRLEVDIRTVRQYVETLRDLGIPVEAERGRYGAYLLRPGYKLPPLIFTEDEALALTLGLLLARRSGLATVAPAVEGALAKIERVLPEAARVRLRAVQETVIFSEGAHQTTPPTATLTVLSEAVQASRSVDLHYCAPDGLAVHRSLRGSRVGTRILQALVLSATRRGDAEVLLRAQRSAEGFEGFYQRAGFRTRGGYFEEAGRAHIEFFKPL